MGFPEPLRRQQYNETPCWLDQHGGVWVRNGHRWIWIGELWCVDGRAYTWRRCPLGHFVLDIYGSTDQAISGLYTLLKEGHSELP